MNNQKKNGEFTPQEISALRKLANALLIADISAPAMDANLQASDKFCNQSKAAKILGISPSTLYRRCSINCPDNLKFPFKPKRVGRKLRFFIPELEAYLRDK